MKDIKLNGKLSVVTDFKVIALPEPGISKNEAIDKWLEAGPDNKVLDYGDKSEPNLVVAKGRSKQVIYELVPELSPPGFTVQQMMQHMRSAGWDVRGEGPISKDGNPTVVVVETEH